MKILVMGDAHLKVELLNRIDKLMDEHPDWCCVSLGDWADDWGAEPKQYEKFFNRLIAFARKYSSRFYPCWGNHDFGYMSNPGHHTGYNVDARSIVRDGIMNIEYAIEHHIQAVHKIDEVLFSHAGICKSWLSNFKQRVQFNIDDSFLDFCNFAPVEEVWSENSPLWYRPHGDDRDTFNSNFMQVIGHTPVPTAVMNPVPRVLMTDTWSTDSNGDALGDKSLVVVDTENQTWVALYEEKDYE